MFRIFFLLSHFFASFDSGATFWRSLRMEDACGGVRLSRAPSSNVVTKGADQQTVNALQFGEQSLGGNDYAPKVRKPYTITKQRERWTDEEHKKFIEALKLYGRAWRRIEEHVGTKTAVQIRSHAQKFFSKVTRETTGSNGSPVEPIVIPPPRPKRKPMHPYPRKMGNASAKEASDADHRRRTPSPSPSLLVSERENQSPTSVLSTVGSDALGSSESNSPNGGLSPVSSVVHCKSTLYEPYSLTEACPSASIVTATSAAEEPLSLNLELFPSESFFVREESAEEPMKQSLKLFGKTVLVTDLQRSSSPATLTCRKSQQEKNDEKPVQPLPRKLAPAEATSQNQENLLSWIQPHKAEHANACSDSKEKESQNEGSSTGSNSGLVDDAENADKSSEVETRSPKANTDKKETQTRFSEFKISERSAFSQIRGPNSRKQKRGFVPYKKRKIVEADMQSSTTAHETRDEQDIHLCL